MEKNNNNNSSNSQVFGQWQQTKTISLKPAAHFHDILQYLISRNETCNYDNDTFYATYEEQSNVLFPFLAQGPVSHMFDTFCQRGLFSAESLLKSTFSFETNYM